MSGTGRATPGPLCGLAPAERTVLMVASPRGDGSLWGLVPSWRFCVRSPMLTRLDKWRTLQVSLRAVTLMTDGHRRALARGGAINPTRIYSWNHAKLSGRY